MARIAVTQHSMNLLRLTCLSIAVSFLGGCSKNAAKTQPAPDGAARNEAATGGGGKNQSAEKGASLFANAKFRVQEVADSVQGGLIAFRFAVPLDWKSGGRVEWHYNDLYTPMRAYYRAESPDGSSWIEGFPFENFYWLDPRWDNFNGGGGSVGGIHHTNVTVQEAMLRYIIARYRATATNLQIVGHRPVRNLAEALGKPATAGDGIDIRVRYQIGNEAVDEEFFGLMTPVLTIPYTGPQGTTYEYHRTLEFVHSLGAKRGKLDSMRPLLGYIVHSFEADKIWEKHMQAVCKQLNDAYQRHLQAGYAQIEAAGRLSRSISANNDAMVQAMDQQRAAAASRRSASPNGEAHRPAEDFDQYIRGTERMEDSSGQVSEQSYLYNYHWSDGSGNYVHSNDATFNPNNHSNQTWEKLKPAK